MSAPNANERNDETAAPSGEPSLFGIDAELFAGVRLQREFGVTHHLFGELARPIGIDARDW